MFKTQIVSFSTDVNAHVFLWSCLLVTRQDLIIIHWGEYGSIITSCKKLLTTTKTQDYQKLISEVKSLSV